MKKIHLFVFLFFSINTISLFSQQYSEQTGIPISGVSQGSAAWGDYNNDGFLDLLISGWSDGGAITKIYKNNGNNSFTEQTGISLPGVFLSSLAWGDYDNDGDLDILLTGTTSGNTSGAITRIYRNNNGNFVQVPTSLPGIYAGSVAWGDYDNDGDLDILFSGMSDSAERITMIYSNNGSGNFTPLQGTSFKGINYGSVAWGDYDNDGYPDILLSGQDASFNRHLKVYHNNRNNSFTEITNTQFKGVYYSSAVWGDYNKDGFLDIIAIGEDALNKSTTKIYQNNGNGNFNELTGISLTGIKRGAVAWGDSDNDGDLDIFVSGKGNPDPATRIYTNCTDSSFCYNSEPFPGVTESSFITGDYDNDGDLDLLLTGQDKDGVLISRIYKNNSATVNNKPGKPLGFQYQTTGTTALLNWRKVYGDETPAKSISYNLRIGRNLNKPDFVSPHSDLTGFRKLAAMGNAQLDTSFIFKNLRWDTTYYAAVQAIDNSYKGGIFSENLSIKITPVQPAGLIASYITTTSIRLKWKRGNGDKCIVFATEGSSGPAIPVNHNTYYANSVFREGSPLGATDWYCIYKGDSDSVLMSGLQIQKDYTVHVIEFQGTTGSELYATGTNENIGIFSTGLFTNQTGIPLTGLRYSSVAWGDYNNDGLLDLVITGKNLSGTATAKIYSNDGDNTFTDQTGISLAGVYFGSVGWGDYNNDGYLDLLVAGYNDVAGPVSKVYKNNGNNSFTEQTDISLKGVYSCSSAWGDYDNDGDLDILLTGYDKDNIPSSIVYRNDNNVFSEQTGIKLTGVYNGSVAWGDYNNDGKLDILLTGFDSGGNRLSKVYKNNGTDNFVEQTNIVLKGVGYSSVSWGDYDKDGNLDILLTGATGVFPNYNSVSRIYRNNGNNTFTELANTSLVGISNGAAAWGDYNNDGYLDILLTGYSDTDYIFKIYNNNGNQTFTDLPYVQVPGGIACSVAWADYDNDGDLDILFSGYTGALTSRIYRNNFYMKAGAIRPNLKPGAPTGLKYTITPGNVKLYWNLTTNDETSYKNMSYNVRCRLENDPQWSFSPQSLDNGSRSLVSLGNVQLNRFFNIKNPVSGKYYWQVQAVDQGFTGSAWSQVDSFMVKNTQAFFKTDTVCHGLPTHFTDQSVVFDGIASWKWDLKDGTISSVQNPVHTYQNSGTYKVKLLVTSKTGDKDSVEQNVIVKARPKTSFKAPNVCVGSPTVITNTTNVNGLTISGWLWEYGDDQTSTLAQPGTHTFSLKGTYKTRLTASASNGCSDTITNNVIVAGYPSPSISSDNPLTFCRGALVNLSAEYDPLYIYQWKMDNTDITNATQKTLKVDQYSAGYSARITNTLANCVTNSEQKAVSIKENPLPPAIISDNYKTGECLRDNPIKLKVEQPVTGYNYQWLRNKVPVNKSTLTYLEGFPDEGDYTVEAEINGCRVPSEKFVLSYQGAPLKPIVFA